MRPGPWLHSKKYSAPIPGSAVAVIETAKASAANCRAEAQLIGFGVFGETSGFAPRSVKVAGAVA
jgi:hypothetical protein